MRRTRGTGKAVWSRDRLLLIGAAALLIACISYAGWPLFVRAVVLLEDAKEDLMITFFPSPSREFAYAELHFDESNAALYDIRRAQYLFTLVVLADPSYPYLYHELARISFLQGDYEEALIEIDDQIAMHGDSEPNSYYVRGLIEGYMGEYSVSADDYAYFLKFDPNDWAAMNDDAWVLLKAQRFQEAAAITARGLSLQPDNPWLLNSRATALYELGDYKEALADAQQAQVYAATLTDAQWSHAYPGNDPGIAQEGLATFRQAIVDNIHTISLALGTSTIQ